MADLLETVRKDMLMFLNKNVATSYTHVNVNSVLLKYPHIQLYAIRDMLKDLSEKRIISILVSPVENDYMNLGERMQGKDTIYNLQNTFVMCKLTSGVGSKFVKDNYIKSFLDTPIGGWVRLLLPICFAIGVALVVNLRCNKPSTSPSIHNSPVLNDTQNKKHTPLKKDTTTTKMEVNTNKSNP